MLVIRPLVTFCLRHGVRLQDLIECFKISFVESAANELEKVAEAVTASRISVMTGVHRRDVVRIRKSASVPEVGNGLTTGVIGQWTTDAAFLTKQKKPRALSFGNVSSEFYALVQKVNKDLNPATVLFELERVGAVKRGDDGLTLCAQAYVPKGNVVGSFQILADDIDTLFHSVEENIIGSEALPNLHLRTAFDKVRKVEVPEIRAWLLREGHSFHVRVRDFIAEHDQDTNPKIDYEGEYVKVAAGSFSKVMED